MKRYFITATGTDIGKTFYTAALTWQLRGRGVRVNALKPVISGFAQHHAATDSDTSHLLAAQNLPAQDFDLISPWRFSAPLSPDMAAALEGRTIELGEIIAFSDEQKDYDVQLIEGVGGVMAPLTERYTMLDWMERMNLPVILIAGTYVGTLSHTLTALQVLQARNLQVHSIILNPSRDSAASPEQTRDSLAHHAGDLPIRLMQRLDSCTEIWKNAPNLTEGFL